MATLRQNSRTDENGAIERQKGAAKAQGGQQRGQQRKALGDIGNLVGPFNTRCNVGKENAGGKGADAAVKPASKPGVMTRRSAAAAGVVIDEKILGQWGANKRSSKGSKDGEEAEEPVGSRNSLTGLLMSRSENAAASKPPASPMPDIDSADRGDPLAATDYVEDIFAYYRRVESAFRTAPDYMKDQADINDKMRAILLDWLVEVHQKFKMLDQIETGPAIARLLSLPSTVHAEEFQVQLLPETLFLTTNLIDRFLAKQHVTRKNLQLNEMLMQVGVTAMLIASKYEEIWAPEVRDFVYISDRAYTKEQILAMEKLILNTLKFDLTVPTPNTFLCRFLKAAGGSKEKLFSMHAAYLVELSMPDYGMLKYSPSEIAASAVYVASRALRRTDSFPPALAKHSGFKLTTLRPCITALEKLQQKASSASLVAVFKKYSNSKYLEVATKFGTLQAAH